MPTKSLSRILKNLQETPTDRQSARRRTWGLAAGATAFLLIVGGFVHSALKESLGDLFSASLTAVVKAESADLKAWIEGEKHAVQGLADAEPVREAASALGTLSDMDFEDLAEFRESPFHASITESISVSHTEKDYVGYFMADRSGRILSSDNRSLIGRHVSSEGAGVSATVFEKGTAFSPPIEWAKLFGDETEPNSPVLVFGSVVRSAPQSSNVALFLLRDPLGEFGALFRDSGVGKTGHTFAFDSAGRLITQTRHDDLFRELGLVAPESASGVLTIRTTDPGAELTRRRSPPHPPSERPLTRMAASAVSGSSGFDIDGYRDFRGTTVLGAWRWLPEHRIGVATEIDRREALRLLRPIRIALYSLLGMFVSAAVFVVHNSTSTHRLKRQISQIRFLGQYELEEKIGEGGMGTVYKARHALLQRPTAIKLLRSDNLTESSIVRFEREVQLTSQLEHPNTIEIYDFGRTEQGIFYYVMEYLEGPDLHDLLRIEGALPAARAIHILRQVLFSLREAHEKELVHRDIKPSNIILCERGGVCDFVKVLDFGLARGLTGGDSVYQTSSRTLTGTPLYLAPERMTDLDSTDPRSDLYAVGMVAFNLLTGKSPFEFSSDYEVFHHIVNTRPKRPSEATDARIPKSVDDLVFACLQKDPLMRPQNAQEMISILEAAAEDDTWTEEDARKWWKEYREKRCKAGGPAGKEASRRMDGADRIQGAGD